jgi:2-oxoglutarate ferredoxin oxidoreductase subunit alpha
MTMEWGRYLDIDGDGIPYRTLPGNKHPRSAYFARGTGHDEYANYSEDPEIWNSNMERLNRKFEIARKMVPKPKIYRMDNAKIGIIAFGSTDPSVREARDCLVESDIPTDYLQLRALPLCQEVIDFVRDHERVYIIEMNRDGQLHQIISLDIPECATSLISLTQNDGLPLTAAWVENSILAEERK